MEPERLGYVTASTDQEMDLRSRDRAVLARLCRLFGYCMFLVGVLVAVMALAAVAAPRQTSARLATLVTALLISFAPGIVFLTCARRIRAGGTAAVVVAMAMGFGGLCVTTLGIMGAAIAAWKSRTELTAYMTGAIIGLMLATGFGQLAYCAIRVLSLRGRDGADASAVADVREVLSFARLSMRVSRSCLLSGGMMALLHLGLVTAASWLFVLSETPVPVPPAPVAKAISPAMAAPFDGDVYDFADGLPQAQRRIIVELAQQRLALTPRAAQALDRGLGEFGGLLVRNSSQPLTPESARALLQIRRDDRVTSWSWIRNGDRSIRIESFGDGSVGTEYFASAMSSARRPLWDVAELVRRSSSGELHLTTIQARTLYPMVHRLREDRQQLAAVRQISDGSIEIQTTEQLAQTTWITPSGERLGQNPVERALSEEASRARLRETRVLNVSPYAPAGVALISILGALVAALMIAAGWLPRVRTPVALLQIALCAFTVVAWVLLIRSVYHLQEAYWVVRRAAVDPFYILLVLAAAAIVILAGVWTPAAILRGRHQA